MVPRRQLLTHVRRLGQVFARRGMGEHVRKLRLYYLALLHDLTTKGNDLDVKWTESFVLEWMRTLRIPPFEEAYEKRRFGSTCNRCGAVRGAPGGVLTECVFPGGARMRCQGCGSAWIEEGMGAGGAELNKPSF